MQKEAVKLVAMSQQMLVVCALYAMDLFMEVSLVRIVTTHPSVPWKNYTSLFPCIASTKVPEQQKIYWKFEIW